MNEILEVDVEISSLCNLRCSDCLNFRRLHVDGSEKLEDADLVDKLVKYLPKNSRVLFVGLGEPTMIESQEKIIDIFSRRKDLTGFIQTNGCFELRSELVDLVDSGRILVGVSYDFHHLSSGQSLKIQRELVSSVAIAVGEDDNFDEVRVRKLRGVFPNVDKVLIEPLIVDFGKGIETSWERVEEVASLFVKVLDGVGVYIELFEHFDYWNGFRAYFRDAMGSGLERVDETWFKSSRGFYVFVDDVTEDYVRVLANGKVLTDNSKIGCSWGELNKLDMKKIEEFFVGA